MMYDVAIIGGGPAGSTAATLLAQAGRSVVVLEREKFPRFHIGESLLPYSMDALERLGVREKLEAAGFVVKHGAGIASACGKSKTRFYFKDGFRSRRATALQVERSIFDQILLDHSRECGAHVRESTLVSAIDFSGSDPVLTIDSGSGSELLTARYVLDCSGRNSVVGSLLDLKQEYPDLQKFAIYAHYEGVSLPEGIDGSLTRMVRATDQWFWLIPLAGGKVSVGVVMDTANFRAMKRPAEEVLESCLRDQPVLQAHMAGARRVTKIYASGDYSYRNRQLFGSRWLMAGDAAGFIDPIFSSGVFLAILGGEQAADALHAVLDRPERARALFRRYEKHLNRVMGLYLKFVRSWYRHEFVETLLAPQEFFQVVPAVNAVLAGNSGKSLALRWRLALFHLIVRLQRRFAISPKLTFKPKVS